MGVSTKHISGRLPIYGKGAWVLLRAPAELILKLVLKTRVFGRDRPDRTFISLLGMEFGSIGINTCANGALVVDVFS